ncbi:CAAX amino terminal protease self- immunity [Novipirellula galeiformis]|uniref:CAAX amino terminal protease self-immunity n=1 Tax=Novipirellula galeiformis TaxID=2528004 RepID=A0A5C6CC97_9BACT|nr:type II CAAX endopeptidase family protein [Novipirellula galeiformis]TWU21064.1 CAAX amino terminal protease self- immunity [Novipirellula galeiformis]
MEIGDVAAVSAIVLVIAGCLGLWGKTIHRVLRSNRSWSDAVLPAESRDRPFWAVSDAMLMFGLSLVISLLAMKLFIALGQIPPAVQGEAASSDALLAGLSAQSVGGLIAFAGTLGFLRIIRPDAAQRLGLVWKRSDVVIGLRASLMLIPPTLLIAQLASQMVEYQHPVLDVMKQSPTPVFFIVLFMGTALVAPWVEEFLFRVLLQGSLQSFADRPDEDELALDPDDENAADIWRPRSLWPLFLTSLIFALMHGNQGAAAIPLFFFSVGLGFLYRQTGRITPSLVVHIVLNSFTMSVEMLRLWLAG